jgi:hypothetical protein
MTWTSFGNLFLQNHSGPSLTQWINKKERKGKSSKKIRRNNQNPKTKTLKPNKWASLNSIFQQKLTLNKK